MEHGVAERLYDDAVSLSLPTWAIAVPGNKVNRFIPHGGWEFAVFVHDGITPVLEEVDGLRHVMRKLAVTVVWLSGTEIPVVQVSQDPQVAEVAEIGVPLPDESQPVPVERIKDGMLQEMVDRVSDRNV